MLKTPEPPPVIGSATARAARPRLAERVRSIPPSGIRRFFDVIATMKDVISLSIGEPDFATPHQIRAAAARAVDSLGTKYASNAGLIELRRAISAHVKGLYGVDYDPEREIIVTTGVSEGL